MLCEWSSIPRGEKLLDYRKLEQRNHCSNSSKGLLLMEKTQGVFDPVYQEELGKKTRKKDWREKEIASTGRRNWVKGLFSHLNQLLEEPYHLTIMELIVNDLDQMTLTSSSVSRMDERLSEASRKGNIATLIKLLEEDPLILEDNSKHASAEIPLHVASFQGHTVFVRRKDTNGRTPMHLAVIRGRDRVVAALILACSESVREETDRRETILHLTMKSENGCKMLRGLLEGFKDKAMLNWKDDEGNTVLHWAAVRKQHKVRSLN
ncbi:hypothetical protein REPUB_Repub18cG0096900 [Reevesia pubescens]